MVNEVGVVSPEEMAQADGEQQAAGCGPGLAAGHGAGWIWGDPADGIPADAPLHTLLLAASRIMGAYYAGTLAQCGPADQPGWTGRAPGPAGRGRAQVE